ncbi:hypothetical protein L3Q82_003842 [Scortum barcoo]|uniref:Uncharacterized protein n=1 Tax=Scortum barcoo TaxID=214431 RepID=A0ACB8X6A0_9TELE|nr:hypothetical protein L3Q82_003842 [Scortum barcoo]
MSDQSDSALRDCFSTTECGVCLRTQNINTHTGPRAVIGYIGKCIDDVVPRITVQTFPSQKPWVNGEDGQMNGQMPTTQEHVGWIKNSNGDYKKKISSAEVMSASLPDELNTFYARFESNLSSCGGAKGSGGPLPTCDIQGRPFNTIVPSKLFVTKLRDLGLGLNSALCDWILNFLMRADPRLSNTIVKFADGKFDMTVIGLITGDTRRETAYREEVTDLTSWCQDNNLHLNVSKTKELIVDFRRRQREEHAPLSINGTTVERVSSFRFLGVHISEDLTWTHHTDFITKSARQRLFFLRRLRRLNMDSRILCSFYRCTIERILTGYITAWYSSCTALNRKRLYRGRNS